MLALFTAIGGQLWDNDQTRLAKAILSTNAVLFNHNRVMHALGVP
jgi:hypothetical protein